MKEVGIGKEAAHSLGSRALGSYEHFFGPCGRLPEAGLSDMTIMGIAGHVSREMLAHYSHIRMRAKREAVATLETIEQVGWVADNAETRPN